jgi:ATP synthase protein I
MKPSPPPAPPTSRPSLGLAAAGWSAGVTGTVGVALVVVAALAGGRPQMVGAGAGTVLVCVFFGFGVLNTAVAAAYAPQASLLVALLTYVVQVVGLALVLLWVTRSDLVPGTLDDRWLAGSVITGTLVWTGVLLVRTVRGAEVRR